MTFVPPRCGRMNDVPGVGCTKAESLSVHLADRNVTIYWDFIIGNGPAKYLLKLSYFHVLLDNGA